MPADPALGWGPNTAAVSGLLEQAEHLTQTQLAGLAQAGRSTRGAGEHALLHMPRDYAWFRLHEALEAHDLTAAFKDLWAHLLPLWPHDYCGNAIRDAACATLLAGHTWTGPFRGADLDLLTAPWKSVVERDPRSRLALEAAHAWPHEVDEAWWAAIDAALAPRQALGGRP